MKDVIKFILAAAALMSVFAALAALFGRQAEKAALYEYDGETMFIG